MAERALAVTVTLVAVAALAHYLAGQIPGLF